MATEIRHDTFGRFSVVRERCADFQPCSSCGQRAKYRYGIEWDDRPYRYNWADGKFCGIACARSYGHGL